MSKMIKSFKSDLSNGEINKMCVKIQHFLEVCEKESLFLEDIKANIVSLGDYNFLSIELRMMGEHNKKYPKKPGLIISKEVRNDSCENLSGYVIQSVKSKKEAIKSSLNHMFSNDTMLRIMIYDRDSWITF